MSSAESKAFRVELTGTPGSLAEREHRVLRQVFGEDVDLDVNVLGITVPMYDIVDGRMVEVGSVPLPPRKIE